MRFRVFDKVRALARVGVYGACVFTVLGALAVRSAWGDAGESSMVVGRELVGMRELVARSQRVRLNGEDVFVASAIVDGTPQAVLDRVERLCREGSKDLDAVVKDPEGKLPGELRQKLDGLGPFALGILRQQGETEGVVGCLARPGDGGLSGLSQRLSAFAKSRDLGDIGKLRYFYAREAGDGKTHVVTVWTDGGLKLGKMFPAEGEPDGSDPPDMPKPPGAVRVLSAEIEGAPYGVRIYDVPGSAGEALRFIDEQMPKKGWVSMAEVAKVEGRARHFGRDGLELLVVAEESKSRTALSVVAMRAER